MTIISQHSLLGQDLEILLSSSFACLVSGLNGGSGSILLSNPQILRTCSINGPVVWIPHPPLPLPHPLLRCTGFRCLPKFSMDLVCPLQFELCYPFNSSSYFIILCPLWICNCFGNLGKRSIASDN